MQKISPCLWYDNQAEEAVNLYTSLFPNSKIGKTSRYNAESAKVSGQKEGAIMTVEFEIEGQKFLALNGGPMFKFTEAVSFTVNCQNQKEVDKYWNALTSEGGQESQCGWLKDKFGLSWQIVPKQLGELMSQGGEVTQRVMHAMFQMKKLDIQKLEEAAAGK